MLRSAVCGMLLLGASSARAADAPPSYALSWVRAEGAEGCPNGRALMAEVERRLGRPVFDAAAERVFEVEVTRFGNTYRSDVFVRDAAGSAIGQRTLQSDEPGCAALVSATALAIALVIDPEAMAREAPPAGSSVAFEPPPSPAPLAPLPAAAVPTPAPSSTPASPPPPAPSAAPQEVVKLSLRGELSGGLVPGASPGVELAINASPSARWGFALTAAYTGPQHVVRGVGSMDLSLTRAAALLTLQAARSENLRVVLGLGPTLGALHLAVFEPAPVTDPGDYWFVAAEGTALLQALVSTRLFVELGGSLFVPLKRQQFLVRGQSEPIWEQPAISGRGFLGAGMLFP